ncbi:MAG: hypothetical protein A3B23_02395 [Candidatus Colwellbacteria bacterium RIFCSPLOWO2_01_FULL_48_10]|uniref:Amino acid amidase n=2 Tax=Bacteria candidate phyla TaxID=1783234 RepID=A0A1F5P0J7_9BACT|nr:MAG: hypothetical protein A2846_03505 [Candidatus Doudnabacteria bacterium RIFCSPHIGHO2_01_FULL_49_9]OGY59972.1 MAG: hypothetical protein A3B23_02395 [Candidatus Colwellbacteria bacterium RIFCSPLOWO2_01_FULL_48_10]
MKIYISADMEGLPGERHWSDVNKGEKGYKRSLKEMTAEVSLVCKTLLKNGVGSITVRDSHGTAKNLNDLDLPDAVQLVSGWTDNLYGMMEFVSRSYNGAIFIGYHAPAGSKHNPLGHFYTTKAWRVKLNGEPLSELRLNTYIAAQEGVPVLCVMGDEDVCREAKNLIKGVMTIESWSQKSLTSGNKTLGLQIRKAVSAGLKLKPNIPKLPKHYDLEVEYHFSRDMRKVIGIKGIRVIKRAGNTVFFRANSLNNLLRTINSVL